MKEEHRRGVLRLATVSGVPVYIHASWLIVFALLTWILASSYFPRQSLGLSAVAYWVRGALAAVLLFASVLVHEGGHAVAARRRGLKVRSVTLFLLGGVARIEEESSDGRTETRVAVAGPAVSLALALLFGIVGQWSMWGPGMREVIRALASINLGLGLFNLLPAFPLDGGRILRGLLWNRLGKVRATSIASQTGSVFATFLLASGVIVALKGSPMVGLWNALVGWFLLDAAGAAYRQVQIHDALQGLTVRDAMTTPVRTIPAFFPLDEAIRSYVLPTGFSAYPVVQDDAVVGILELRELLRVPADERRSRSVQSVMEPVADALIVSPGASLPQAMKQMADTGRRWLLVVEEGRLAGLLTLSAVLRQSRVRQQLGRAA
jgi:Zn-dependent protease/CBS domain-containing protein